MGDINRGLPVLLVVWVRNTYSANSPAVYLFGYIHFGYGFVYVFLHGVCYERHTRPALSILSTSQVDYRLHTRTHPSLTWFWVEQKSRNI